jgi:ADP-L-glycero-D-manno-heptose 6-epimerase
MKSVVAKNYDVVRSGEKVRLFRSHRDEFADGEQLRDFVYVRDCVDIAAWLYDKRPQSGLFNVGSGQARSFNDLISAIAHALETPAYVEYVDMPLSIRDKYQYYTKSNMEKLRRSGYTKPLTTLEDGVSDYVLNHLSSADPFF